MLEMRTDLGRRCEQEVEELSDFWASPNMGARQGPVIHGLNVKEFIYYVFIFCR